MSQLLLEVLSEEIPARMQKNGIGNFSSAIVRGINEELATQITKIGSDSVSSYVTPRRLTVLIDSIDVCCNGAQHEVSSEIKGPRVGAVSTAIEGFMRKYGISDVSELRTKDGFFFYTKIEHHDIRDVLKSAIENVLSSFVWPKSMRWGDQEIRWVRPIHSIICLLDDAVVPVQFGTVVAGNTTRGHRFMAPNIITVRSPCQYLELLHNASVVCDPEQRRKMILDEIHKKLSPLGLVHLEDDDILDELVGLTEFPVVLLGRIDECFMSLPSDILRVVLRKHQKFMLTRYVDGGIAPYFIIVANIKACDENSLIEGNTRVMRARLADANFFLDADKQTPLCQRVEKLRGLTFHCGIGNMYEKMERVVQFARILASYNDIDVGIAERSAVLLKCDLTTHIVGEFPELQGIMGGYYAACDGEGEEVSLAVMDHYRPQGPADSIPRTRLGAIVAVADKLDTLNAMFGHGIRPTGSKDPYALRRAALGIIRIVKHYDLKVNLAEYGVDSSVLSFLEERLNHWSDTEGDAELKVKIMKAFV